MKLAIAALISGNLIFFNLWQSEKEKRIAQETVFFTSQEEKKIKDDKSVETQKKIAIRRKKEAKEEKNGCDCVNHAIPADIIEWLHS